MLTEPAKAVVILKGIRDEVEEMNVATDEVSV